MLDLHNKQKRDPAEARTLARPSGPKSRDNWGPHIDTQGVKVRTHLLFDNRKYKTPHERSHGLTPTRSAAQASLSKKRKEKGDEKQGDIQ